MVSVDAERITEVWDEFAAAGFQYASDSGDLYELGENDEVRRERLPRRREILQGFLDGDLDIESFRSEMASEAGQHKLWGYSGTSGGMFFNMLISASDPSQEPDIAALLREVLVAPGDQETAVEYITKLEDAVNTIRARSENIQSAPQAGYIPYFLSYYW